jgi:hypothetical protein
MDAEGSWVVPPAHASTMDCKVGRRSCAILNRQLLCYDLCVEEGPTASLLYVHSIKLPRAGESLAHYNTPLDPTGSLSISQFRRAKRVRGEEYN